MNKFILICLLAFLGFGFTSALKQSTPEKWVFIGILVNEQMKGCVNKPHTDYESFWLPYNSAYDEAFKAKLTALKAKYPGRTVDYKRVNVIAGKPKVIALAAKIWKCGASNLGFYDGATEAEIIAKLEKDMKDYDNVIDYKILNTFQTDNELQKVRQQ